MKIEKRNIYILHMLVSELLSSNVFEIEMIPLNIKNNDLM